MIRDLDQGGSERQCAETARWLDRSRFQAHVGAMNPYGSRATELRTAGVPTVHLPVRSFRRPSVAAAALRMGRYLSDHHIQVVHAFDGPMTVFGMPTARLFRAPVVISSQRGHRSLMPEWMRHMLRLTDLLVDAIVVNCRAMQRHLIEEERVPPALVRLCYNGLDTARFFPAPAVRPDVLRDASLVIGVVCALRPEKDLGSLIEAFAQVRPLRPGMKLLIVGSGLLLPDLEARTRALGVRQDCVFQPSTADVALWLRAIDIFVLPSLSEALSNSLMEAMGCACAVAASRVGGNPELVTDAQTGLLFEPGNSRSLAAALATLVTNPELRRRVASTATNFIHRNFSFAEAGRRMGEIYEELLERKRSGGPQPQRGQRGAGMCR